MECLENETFFNLALKRTIFFDVLEKTSTLKNCHFSIKNYFKTYSPNPMS